MEAKVRTQGTVLKVHKHHQRFAKPLHLHLRRNRQPGRRQRCGRDLLRRRRHRRRHCHIDSSVDGHGRVVVAVASSAAITTAAVALSSVAITTAAIALAPSAVALAATAVATARAAASGQQGISFCNDCEAFKIQLFLRKGIDPTELIGIRLCSQTKEFFLRCLSVVSTHEHHGGRIGALQREEDVRFGNLGPTEPVEFEQAKLVAVGVERQIGNSAGQRGLRLRSLQHVVSNEFLVGVDGLRPSRETFVFRKLPPRVQLSQVAHRLLWRLHFATLADVEQVLDDHCDRIFGVSWLAAAVVTTALASAATITAAAISAAAKFASKSAAAKSATADAAPTVATTTDATSAGAATADVAPTVTTTTDAAPTVPTTSDATSAGPATADNRFDCLVEIILLSSDQPSFHQRSHRLPAID